MMKRRVGWFVFVILFLGFSVWYSFVEQNLPLTQTTQSDMDQQIIDLIPGRVLSQKIQMKSGIIGFRIFFTTHRRTNPGMVDVQLLIEDQIAETWSVESSSLRDNQYHVFYLREPKRTTDVIIATIVLSTRDGQEQMPVSVLAEGKHDKTEPLFVDHTEQSKAMRMDLIDQSFSLETFVVMVYFLLVLVGFAVLIRKMM